MANRYILFFLFTLGFIQSGFCQHYTIKGRVVDNKNKSPMEFVTVYLPGYELWAISNEKGAFTINQVPVGKVKITAQYLGYVTQTLDIDVQKNIEDLLITLQENNLTLNEVVVTAQKK